MIYTKSSAPVTPGSGLNVGTYTDPSTGIEYQAIVLVDANGNPISIDSNSGGLNTNNITGSRQDLDSVTSFTNSKLTSPAITSSGEAVTGTSKIHGIFVSAASGTPTIAAYDGTGTNGTIKIPTFTPIAGQFYPFPGFLVGTGLYLSIGGTVTLVVYYDTTTG